jgi:ATP-dependent protease HslVU (ClpYQ) peptidase subunit
MTTIVGIRREQHKEVWVGSDTLLTSPGLRLGKMSKTALVNAGTDNETCIAIAGPATAILAVQDILSELQLDDWSTTLAVYRNMLAIHCQMRDHHGLITTEHEDDTFESSQFQSIVANSHGMWMTLNSREVIPVVNLCAIGSGREIAIGVVEGMGMLDPEATIKRALMVASQYDKSTGKEAEIWSNEKNPH